MVVMLFFYPNAAGWIQYQSNPEYILYFSIIVGIDASAPSLWRDSASSSGPGVLPWSG
jgi:hypothetical protein